MAQVLRQIPIPNDPNLLVGLATGDDAAVYRLNAEISLVQTLDFFPPIVDDPFIFGEIAAANAFSDVYAMGGQPLLALNIVGFPDDLSKDILIQILEGGLSKAKEAGVIVVGGHTISDHEPKYGMSVTGILKTGTHIANSNAQVGDILVLTKPIGTGIITTGLKNDSVETNVLQSAVDVMRTLNHQASHAMLDASANACVDVTGFGLVGHLTSMLNASGVGARISMSKVPILPGVQKLAEKEIIPKGTKRNLESASNKVVWNQLIPTPLRLVLCDAQTSGGLLISVPQERLDLLLEKLRLYQVETHSIIGKVVDRKLTSPQSLAIDP